MRESDTMKTIGYTTWDQKGTIFYVAEIKGKIGDWGYVTDCNKAINLTLAQQRKFAADCRFCGHPAQFLTLTV